MRGAVSRGAAVRVCRTVALLEREPAGTVAVRTAGMARFNATLTWRSPEEVPAGPLLAPLPDLDGRARFRFTENGEAGAAARRIRGEVRALSREDLGGALDAALRLVAGVAALREAVLEVEVSRCAEPAEPDPRAVEDLARGLRSAGFPVRLAECWEAVAEAEVCVGCGGDGGVEKFLRSRPDWKVV